MIPKTSICLNVNFLVLPLIGNFHLKIPIVVWDSRSEIRLLWDISFSPT